MLKHSSSSEFHKATAANGPAVDEQGLLRKIQSGDEGAYNAVFQQWYPALVRVAGALLKDSDAAEEIAQDAMVELWQRRSEIKDGGTIGNYLMRSVRNRALNHLRHLKIRHQSAGDVEAMYRAPLRADQPVVAQELAAAIQQAFAALPPGCREAFELSRARGMTYPQIAETLDISTKTVEARMSSALKIMRTQLADWMPKADLEKKHSAAKPQV